MIEVISTMAIPLGYPGIAGDCDTNYMPPTIVLHYSEPAPFSKRPLLLHQHMIGLLVTFLRRLSSLSDWTSATAKQTMFQNGSFSYETRAR